MGKTVHRWMPEDVLEMVQKGAARLGISESAYIAVCVRGFADGGNQYVSRGQTVTKVDVTREPFRE